MQLNIPLGDLMVGWSGGSTFGAGRERQNQIRGVWHRGNGGVCSRNPATSLLHSLGLLLALRSQFSFSQKKISGCYVIVLIFVQSSVEKSNFIIFTSINESQQLTLKLLPL